jgi:quinone-modifying oxidoreductase subunit QmoA
MYPDSKVTIFYIDIRTPGKYDTFQTKIAADPGVSMVKGKVAFIEEDPSTGDVLVTAEHILEGKKVVHKMDMVVLATGMEPNGAGTGAGIPMHNEDGFIALDQLNPGMFATGVAKNPTDVTNSLMDAMSTVIKTMSTGELKHTCVPDVELEMPLMLKKCQRFPQNLEQKMQYNILFSVVKMA